MTIQEIDGLFRDPYFKMKLREYILENLGIGSYFDQYSGQYELPHLVFGETVIDPTVGVLDHIESFD